MQGKVNFCEAIARMEGWLVPDSRCRRNHNPGDIEYGPFAKAHGATGSDGRFAIFPDDATGFRAMAVLLGRDYAGMTLAAAISRYAPPNENDTEAYIRDVSEWTGIQPGDVLAPEMFA